jgi:hypothetical protein
MSVKRLELLNDLNIYISNRLKELSYTWDHSTHAKFHDILYHHGYAHRVNKELLEKAKVFRERDIKKKQSK